MLRDKGLLVHDLSCAGCKVMQQDFAHYVQHPKSQSIEARSIYQWNFWDKSININGLRRAVYVGL